jgi:hypothetical protein
MARRCAGPLHVREDEEPDVEHVHFAAAGRTCRHCGHESHLTEDCPHRPAPKAA